MAYGDELVSVGDYLQDGESVEAALDRLALASPHSDLGKDLEETEVGMAQKMAIVRYLMRLRIRDEKAFDALCLKMMIPEATHQEIAEIMVELEKAGWSGTSGRVRSYERFAALVDRFPVLDGLAVFDRRGGDQGGARIHPADLEREYLFLVDQERRKPLAERRKAYGEDGLYAEVARTCGVDGIDGKPSWQAARKRIVRWRRESRARGDLFTEARKKRA